MKVLILCGSLESGRDGVGDYTRLLAGELIKLQYSVAIVSINDFYVSNHFTGEQTVNNTNIPAYRLPGSWSWKRRMDALSTIVAAVKPELISLQVVLYGFHAKGLPFSLAKNLSSIQGCKWHIMFHELWFGMEENRGLKETVYAKLQSHIIFKMLDRLKPVAIHTQTALYQAQLAKRGYTARRLPLFGNIPKVETGFREKKNQIAVFGSIYPEAQIETFASAYTQLGTKGTSPVKILFIGRNGAERERWIERCQKASIATETLGELSVEKVSEVLQTCIAGISTTPALLIDKSGAVAALREHDLPVIDLARPWKAKGIDTITPPADLLNIQSFFDHYRNKSLPKTNYPFGLEYTARLFVQDLHLETL